PRRHRAAIDPRPRRRGHRVRRRDLLMLVVGLTAAAPLSGAAQPLGLPTIGVLLHGSERVIPQVLTEALRELGYIDGQNVQLEFRSAEGNSQRLPAWRQSLSAERSISSWRQA